MLNLPDKRTAFRAGCLAIAALAACLPVSKSFGEQPDPERLIEAGHWKKARTVVESGLRQNPDDARGTFLLSQIRNAFGDYTSPEMLAEKAIALDPRVAKYHRQLAEVLGVKAQHAGAFQLLFLARQFRKEIDTAIGLDPRDLQALRDLMEFYLLAPGIAGGDAQKAAAIADRIGAIDAPEGFMAKARIAAFRKQTAQAESLLHQAVEAQPASYRARIELAHGYLQAQPADPGGAESMAKEAMKLDRSRAEPYAVLAEIYAGRGAWNQLEEILTESSRQNPDDLAPYYRAAETLLRDGRDPARAESYLRTYLGEEPEGNEPSAADARRKLALAVDARRRGAHTVTERTAPPGSQTN